MKMPTLIQGVMRKNRRDVISGMGGIVPQDAFCEDVCHQSYAVGSEDHEECLDDCRD